MILYVCETCGTWKDVSFGKFLTNTWNQSFANMPELQVKKEPTGEACERGCGMMRQVKPDDKLCIVDSIKVKR